MSDLHEDRHHRRHPRRSQKERGHRAWRGPICTLALILFAGGILLVCLTVDPAPAFNRGEVAGVTLMIGSALLYFLFRTPPRPDAWEGRARELEAESRERKKRSRMNPGV